MANKFAMNVWWTQGCGSDNGSGEIYNIGDLVSLNWN